MVEREISDGTRDGYFLERDDDGGMINLGGRMSTGDGSGEGAGVGSGKVK